MYLRINSTQKTNKYTLTIVTGSWIMPSIHLGYTDNITEVLPPHKQSHMTVIVELAILCC